MCNFRGQLVKYLLALSVLKLEGHYWLMPRRIDLFITYYSRRIDFRVFIFYFMYKYINSAGDGSVRSKAAIVQLHVHTMLLTEARVSRAKGRCTTNRKRTNAHICYGHKTKPREQHSIILPRSFMFLYKIQYVIKCCITQVFSM